MQTVVGCDAALLPPTSAFQQDYNIFPVFTDEAKLSSPETGGLLGKQPVAQIAVCVPREDGWLFELPLGYC